VLQQYRDFSLCEAAPELSRRIMVQSMIDVKRYLVQSDAGEDMFIALTAAVLIVLL
jgi:hypothetical protein